MFGLIVIEKLNVKGLTGGMLAKAVNDAGRTAFTTKLMYKAAEAGRALAQVEILRLILGPVREPVRRNAAYIGRARLSVAAWL